jgi:hypothetical protein
MRPLATLSAVTITVVTALGVSGCGPDTAPSAPPSELVHATTSGPASPEAAPLPPADALTGVLLRLADTSVPPEQKLALVQYSTPDDEAALGNFGQALADGGFRNPTVDATDLMWAAGGTGDVLATVRIGTPDDPSRSFTFPMEFSPLRDGWQLTRRTADQLLVLGSTPAPPTPPG